MSYFDLTVDEMGPDVVVVTMLDDEAMPDDIVRLRQALKSHIKRGALRFVFDCRDIRNFSSAFIGAVLETASVARKHKTVAIVGTPQHAETLKIFRMDTLMLLLHDDREALEAVRRVNFREVESPGA